MLNIKTFRMQRRFLKGLYHIWAWRPSWARLLTICYLRRFSESRSSSGSTPSVRPSVCPSVRNTLGCQVCVIYNSKSFHSFLFKLCLIAVHILKMCTSCFVHVSYFFSFFRGVELRHFFHLQCLGGV